MQNHGRVSCSLHPDQAARNQNVVRAHLPAHQPCAAGKPGTVAGIPAPVSTMGPQATPLDPSSSFSSAAQIRGADLWIRPQSGRGVVKQHLPRLQHITMMGHRQGQIRILLDQQNGNPPIFVDGYNLFEN